MPDTNERIVALQKSANERLQQAAVARRRWFVRVGFGPAAFIAAGVAGLLWILSHHLH